MNSRSQPPSSSATLTRTPNRSALRIKLAGCALLLAGFATTSVAAEFSRFEPKPRVLEDLFRVEVSAVGASYNTVVRLDADNSTLPNTTINIEDDLGLDDLRALVQGEITFLPGERHLLRLSGQGTRRSAIKQLQRTITFEDDTFVVNGRVASKLDLTLFGLTYGYRFLKRERFELDATFSIQIAEIDANITGRDAAGNQIRSSQDAEDGVAPIPLLGFEGRYDFGSRWSAEGRVQGVGANTQDVQGLIIDARLALTWRQSPYLVYGIGYRRFSIDIDSDDPDDSGQIDLDIKGPMLFLRGSL
jgi:hypothetical protein